MSIGLMKENSHTLRKARSRGYPAETIMDAVYTDDLVLLATTPAQVKSLLYSLEQAVRGIGLHMNSVLPEFMCFKRYCAILTSL